MAEESDSKTFLNDYHKILIAKMIRENKTIIKGVGKGTSIKQRKNQVWQNIYDKVIENGGVIPNVTHLRKVSYGNIKVMQSGFLLSSLSKGLTIKVKILRLKKACSAKHCVERSKQIQLGLVLLSGQILSGI